MNPYVITEDDDGIWLRVSATGELCGPYDTREEAIADLRDEDETRGPWLPAWKALELGRDPVFPHVRTAGPIRDLDGWAADAAPDTTIKPDPLAQALGWDKE